MARTRRHTRMRDVLIILTPNTTAQDDFGGITQGNYVASSVIRCSATNYSGDSNFRDYNQDASEQDWELIIRKKSLPTLSGNEIFALQTPAINMKLNGKVEQDERTYRLRCTALSKERSEEILF